MLSLPHHFVVRVEEVSAPVTVSASLEARPVRQEPVLVVDGDLGHGVHTTRQYHQLLQLDAAGRPDVS